MFSLNDNQFLNVYENVYECLWKCLWMFMKMFMNVFEIKLKMLEKKGRQSDHEGWGNEKNPDF